ncbi:MAG: hypothetical protein AAFZ63_27740 [Bacteroidota bacterium]
MLDENADQFTDPTGEDLNTGEGQTQDENLDAEPVVEPTPEGNPASGEAGSATGGDPSSSGSSPDNTPPPTNPPTAGIQTDGDDNISIAGTGGDVNIDNRRQEQEQKQQQQQNLFLTINPAGQGIDGDTEKQITTKNFGEYTSVRRGPIMDKPSISCPDIPLFCTELRKRRFLFVHCHYSEALHSIYNQMVKELGGYEGRYLIKDIVHKDYLKDHPDSNFYELINRDDIITDRPSILFLSEPSADFVQRVQMDISRIGKLRSRLSDKDSMVVCLMSDSIISRTKADQGLKPFIQEVPFLSHLLSQHFPAEKALALQKKIKQSIHYNDLVGRERFDLIDGVLQDRLSEFEEFVDQIDQQYRQKNQKVFQALLELFNSDDLLVKVVLFVATSFENLGYRDFQTMVSFLLLDKTETIRKPVLGKEKKEVYAEAPYSDRWEAKGSEIFESCMLVHQEQDGDYYVDFQFPDFRRKFRNYLERNRFPFLQQQMDKIKREHLLFRFDLDLSRQLLNNLVRLTIDTTKYEKHLYGHHWLIDLALQIQNELNKIQGAPLETTADPYDQLLLLLEKLNQDAHLHHLKEQINQLFYQRIGDLVEEMLQQDPDRFLRIIEEFIRELINRSMGEYSLNIVLEIAKRLQHSAYFDAGKWLKHIINQEKDEEVRGATYNALFRIFDLEAIYDLLSVQLPDLETNPNGYLQYYAVFFQIHYSVRTIIDVEQDDFGGSPSSCSLLESIASVDAPKAERLQEILKRLLSPAYEHVVTQKLQISPGSYHTYYNHLTRSGKYNDYNTNRTVGPLTLVADVIEGWYLVLRGLDASKKPSAAQKAAISTYCEILRATIAPRQRKILMQSWAAKVREVYNHAIKKHAKNTRAESNPVLRISYKKRVSQLISHRTLLEELRKQL